MSAIELSKREARRFLLLRHGLAGGFRFRGKEGVLAYVRQAGCIQFDPINVVGTNPELVLQSRVEDWHPAQLRELLYTDRLLVDHWDKNMAIYPVEDWPCFRRTRARNEGWCQRHPDAVRRVLEEIRTRGTLSSADLDMEEKVAWPWGPARLARAALEALFFSGRLVVHDKTGNRKAYDLAERCLPPAVLDAPEPFASDEDYVSWHVLRRIGSVGLLWNRPSDAWLGIVGMKSSERNRAFARLLEEDRIREVRVDGLAQPLYVRTADLPTLEKAASGAGFDDAEPRASALAPLDNLLWDRRLVQALFDFDYRWEVYKPASERKYGYYVLPVLCGDRLVARFEAVRVRPGDPFTVGRWWWEKNADATSDLLEALLRGLRRFAGFLGASFDEAKVLSVLRM
jgi:hypothetical protein